MPVIKQLKAHKLLLDTHVWIWLLSDTHKLSSHFKRAADEAAEQERIYIAPISIWEIGMLSRKGRIELSTEPMDWIERLLDLPGVGLAPFSPRIAVESSHLPGDCHGDPADRILIATAHEENCTLVTHDAKILEYGKKKYLYAHDPVAKVCISNL